MWGKEFKHRYFFRGWGTREETAGSKVCVLKQVTPTSNQSVIPPRRRTYKPVRNILRSMPPRARGPRSLHSNSQQPLVERSRRVSTGSDGHVGSRSQKSPRQACVSWHWSRPTYNDMVRPERRGWAPGVSGRWGRGGWGKSTPRDPGMPMLEASSI